MMRHPRQRVLVINNGSVFDTSMLQLLAMASELEVSETTLADGAEFLAAVIGFAPGTIIINDSERADSGRLLQLLKDCQPGHRLRVLVIRMDDNTIEQYEIKQVVAMESADLVALIRRE